MVGHARAERVVAGAILLGGAGALLGLVGAPAGLLASLPRGCRRRADRVRGDPPAARRLRQLRELVGGFVDRLQVALVLVTATRWRDVRVPALGHPPSRQLHGAVVERRFELEQQQCLFDVEDPWHDPPTLATGPGTRAKN